jgi:hypothetical protein
MIRSAVCALLIAAVALVPVRSAAGDPLTVVELFTSQGCSSCPPADALVGELVEREGVLVLSEHVDYWDYLGWRDPFAIPATTQRQRDYARRLGVGYVYTPQMVIQGASQVTGSNREAVFNRLEEPEPWSPLAVDIDRTGDGRIVITVGGAPAGEDAAVWLVLFDKEHTTRVTRGENRGREVRNFNVVRSFTRIGSWNGEATTMTAIMPETEGIGDGCAVIVQAQNTGRILGAARLDLNGN